MRRTFAATLALTAVLAAPLVLAACGEEEHSEVVEGEPLELGELGYNVQLTRFLNPADTQDSAYLVDQPPAAPGTEYLGVFIVIQNDSEEPLPSADEFTVHDTLENAYEPVETESPFALEIGADVPAEGQLPIPDSTAQAGPTQGALVIFNVDGAVSENRPLTLEISSEAGSGEVVLDI